MDGLRTIALKLDFGVSHNQKFERHYCILSSFVQSLHICLMVFVFCSSVLSMNLSPILRTVAVHFTDPFHVSTRVTDKSSDGSLLLQVVFS